MKKILINIITVVGVLIIIVTLNRYKGIEEIVDINNLNKLSYFEIGYKKNILENGPKKNITEKKNLESVTNYLKENKYKVTPIYSYEKLDSMESYVIVGYDNSDKEVIRLCTRGNEYISIYNKNNEFSTYKVLNNDFSLFRNIYNE